MSIELSNDPLASRTRNEYVEKLANSGDSVGLILMENRFKVGIYIEKVLRKLLQITT